MQKNEKIQVKNAAVCFSGLAKTLDLCYPYIKKNLLDALGSYDIFCCIEDDENAGKTNLLNPIKIEKIKSSEVDKIIKNKLKLLKKKNYNTFIFPESSKFNFRNMFQQFFKIKKSFEILEAYMKEKNIIYRHYIRIRFDFLPLDIIKLENFKMKENEVTVPNYKGARPKNELVDMFYVAGDFDTFKICCSLFDNLEKILQENLSIKPTFIQKLYFSFEKNYISFVSFLFRNKGNLSKNLRGAFLLFPKMFYKKFKLEHETSTERILFYLLTSEKKTIKEEKINFIIVRNLDDGLLIFG